jgi:hypothetical protein
MKIILHSTISLEMVLLHVQLFGANISCKDLVETQICSILGNVDPYGYKMPRNSICRFANKGSITISKLKIVCLIVTLTYQRKKWLIYYV